MSDRELKPPSWLSDDEAFGWRMGAKRGIEEARAQILLALRRHGLLDAEFLVSRLDAIKVEEQS